uniref:Uncharacterized protein n=1 Tax=Ixodes ricinus TaxID=34613 RepID=A0A6B0UF63_IXORI
MPKMYVYLQLFVLVFVMFKLIYDGVYLCTVYTDFPVVMFMMFRAAVKQFWEPTLTYKSILILALCQLSHEFFWWYLLQFVLHKGI